MTQHLHLYVQNKQKRYTCSNTNLGYLSYTFSSGCFCFLTMGVSMGVHDEFSVMSLEMLQTRYLTASYLNWILTMSFKGYKLQRAYSQANRIHPSIQDMPPNPDIGDMSSFKILHHIYIEILSGADWGEYIRCRVNDEMRMLEMMNNKINTYQHIEAREYLCCQNKEWKICI